MKPNIRLRDYLNAQVGNEHSPVSMTELMRPFEIEALGDDDDLLKICNITESLESEFCREDLIDPIDVAAAAYSMGHEAAAYFLDETPWLGSPQKPRERSFLLH